MITKAAIREYKVENVLAICQQLKVLWHFEMSAIFSVTIIGLITYMCMHDFINCDFLA